MLILDGIRVARSISAVAGRFSHEQVFRSVSIDSRTTEVGDLFFALRGENFDGHQFIPKAIQAGARGVVVERMPQDLPPDIAIFQVKDTLAALQDLAGSIRQLAAVPVVGVTGSSGKTSTKDLISSVLSSRYRTLKTEGNFNNELGLPLTLLKLEENHQAAVVEMAMRGLGEIDFLCRVARPNGAVITNIGEAHFELLGSVENIAKAKGEILDHIPEDGFAVLHGDSPFMQREAKRCRGKVIFYGEGPQQDVSLKKVIPESGGNRFLVVAKDWEEEFFVPLPGRHSVINSLAAIAVGLEMGLDFQEIRQGLSTANLTSMRLEISQWKGIKIINDSYNANPSSTKAALQVLTEMAGKGSRKIAVLGDMLELGDHSEEGHREVGRVIQQTGVDLLVVVGEQAVAIAHGALEAGYSDQWIRYCRTAREAADQTRNGLLPGDVILVKGSRGMKMEEYVLSLREDNP